MLVFYAVEDRGLHFILAFAAACALGSIYGFLQGAWPVGVVAQVFGAVERRFEEGECGGAVGGR
jgi:hypothetical protein